MKRKKFLLLLPLGFVIFLTSCIDIETSITLQEDGSGTVTMSYFISKMVMELGRLDEEDPFVPLPVSGADFTATAAIVPGLELISVKENEDAKDNYIEAELEFDSIEALSSFLSPDREGDPAVTVEGGSTIFRYTLFMATEEDINQQSMDLIESFFTEDAVSLTIEAPARITSVSHGEITGNGEKAEYSITIAEIFQRNEDIIWEVRW